MAFKVGEMVKWESGAGGGWTKKVGEVVQVIPAKQEPEIWRLRRKFNARSNYGGGMRRDHESYVVMVPGGKTDKAKPVLYWPRAAALKPA